MYDPTHDDPELIEDVAKDADPPEPSSLIADRALRDLALHANDERVRLYAALALRP